MSQSSDSSADPKCVHVPNFTERGERWQGSTTLSILERLRQETLGHSGKNPSNSVVTWSLVGSTAVIAGGAGAKEVWVDLQASVTLEMQCHRCLQAVDWPLQLKRRFRFVGSESQAAALDEEAESFDVLVSSKTFDFVSLLEDELLMALPIAVAHEHCPSPLVADARPIELPKRNLFAALDALKRT